MNEDVTKPMIYIDCGSHPNLGAFSLSGKVLENIEQVNNRNNDMER